MDDSSQGTNSIYKENCKYVSIIGTGDLSRSLSKKLTSSGYKVLCGSRYPESRNMTNRDPEISTMDIRVVSIKEAIESSEIIILGIHSEHMEKTLKPYQDILNGKTLVDISNPSHSSKQISQAEKLARMFTNSHIVKAFNTLSAYALENQQDQGDNKVHIASDSQYAMNAVCKIAQCMGYESVTYNSLSCARELERRQKKLFRGWGKALIIAVPVFISWTIFSTYRYHVEYKFAWSKWPLHTMNKVVGLTAITLLSLCYLPGCVASIVQLSLCTKHRAFPRWLDLWLKARKQLGLLALWLAIVHGIMSVCHNSPAYFKVFYQSPKLLIPGNLTSDLMVSPVSTMNWIGEATYTLGAVAVCLMAILGVTSLPSVGSRLNWRQWVFIQSYLGYVCLLVAIAHAVVQGLPYMIGRPFSRFMKGVSTISLILPLLTVVLRILLLLPCFSIPLYKIRRGWTGCNYTDNVNTASNNSNLGNCMIVREDKSPKSKGLSNTTPLDQLEKKSKGNESIEKRSSDLSEDGAAEIHTSSNSSESGIENIAYSSPDGSSIDSNNTDDVGDKNNTNNIIQSKSDNMGVNKEDVVTSSDKEDVVTSSDKEDVMTSSNKEDVVTSSNSGDVMDTGIEEDTMATSSTEDVMTINTDNKTVDNSSITGNSNITSNTEL